MQWYVAQPDGSTTGPYDEEDLASWIRQGHYPPTVLVWREGLAEWQQARSAIASLPPPLPANAPLPAQPQTQPPQEPQPQQPPQPQAQPPPASFKQLWGQAWGQALAEHQAKHGKPATRSVSAETKAASASSQNTKQREKKSGSCFYSAMKFVFAVACAAILAAITAFLLLFPFANVPPVPSSVVNAVAVISSVYGFIGYYFWAWVAPMFMSFGQRLWTSPVRYFVINVIHPAIVTLLTGGVFVFLFRAAVYG